MARTGTFSAPAGFRDSPDPALVPGEVLASTYQVTAEIARTDTGLVFEARDMLLDRPVALKLAWRDPGTPSLLSEARRCAAVRAPCAVSVYGMGAHHGVEFVAAERVTGRLLADEVAAPLAPETYLVRLRALVSAVARAHAAGIAIGELSGGTVLVGEQGRLVLGRLSLSQVPAFGRHGLILAPEVVRGEVAADDPAGAEAIDLYGLGCAAVELACGAPPFASRDPEREARDHAEAPAPRVAELRGDLPGELSELVEWLLAKQPAGRPRSARDVLDQLDAVIERVARGSRTLRVLVVDQDAARARWLWGLARRSHPGVQVELASEGTDAAHKLVRDMPDLVLVDANLSGVMNALELCMYAHGLDAGTRGKLVLIGEVSARDREVLAGDAVRFLPADGRLPDAVLDVVRAAAKATPRARRPSLVTG